LVSFENYAKVLTEGTSVVVTARLQCVYFKTTAYIHLVPMKMQAFGPKAQKEEPAEDIF